MLCFLSAGISQAATTYIWSGGAGNGIYGDTNNWTVDGTPNGYYPQSNGDDAIIGEGVGTITWSNQQDHFGATGNIQLGSGNTLLCTTYAGVGDFQVNTVTLEGNAHLVFESTNAFGINKDFMLNFGTFSAAEHGSWTAADTLTSGPKTTPSPSLKHWTWAAFPEPATATLGLLGLGALLLRRRRK